MRSPKRPYHVVNLNCVEPAHGGGDEVNHVQRRIRGILRERRDPVAQDTLAHATSLFQENLGFQENLAKPGPHCMKAEGCCWERKRGREVEVNAEWLPREW
jgi:hypothetical protein